MPLRSGFKVSSSLNPNGTGISNLRNRSLVDYLNSTRVWNVSAGSVSSTPTNNSSWGTALPNCLQLAPFTLIETPILVSTVGAFTVMMRLRIPTLSTANELRTDAIFTNGQSPFFQINYRYDPTDPENPVHSLIFSETNSGQFLITSSVTANTWYHIAITLPSSGSPFNIYLNGGKAGVLTAGTLSAWNTKSYFGLDTENAETLQLTDFVVLRKELTSTEIANYSAAAFL